MSQKIGVNFRSRAESQPLNERFKDITGPCILSGFRLQKGSQNFSISLVRAEYLTSMAIAPSGVKVEENTDLIDILPIEPNMEVSGLPRVDSIYLVYTFGTSTAQATYKVIKGTNVPLDNPNKLTHLLLGYVYVYPNNQPLRTSDMVSLPYGFSHLHVAGQAVFNGEAIFNEPVRFNGPVEFMDGTSGGGGGTGGSTSKIERLQAPILATAGQQTFTLPFSYSVNTKSLFVYKNERLQPPSEYQEVSTTSFKFHTPLDAGDKVWAYAYSGVTIYSPAEHSHDDRYYQKWEIANRSIRYAQDYFAGSSGRTVTHYLGHTNYIIVSVLPVEKTADVGTISVEPRANEIIVYNTGTYRGKFHLTYQLKVPFEYTATNEDKGFLNIQATTLNNITGVYEVVEHKRQDGTMYMKSTLHTIVSGRYSRLKTDYYNTSGTQIIETKTWALNYDQRGNVISKTLI